MDSAPLRTREPDERGTTTGEDHPTVPETLHRSLYDSTKGACKGTFKNPDSQRTFKIPLPETTLSILGTAGVSTQRANTDERTLPPGHAGNVVDVVLVEDDDGESSAPDAPLAPDAPPAPGA